MCRPSGRVTKECLKKGHMTPCGLHPRVYHNDGGECPKCLRDARDALNAENQRKDADRAAEEKRLEEERQLKAHNARLRVQDEKE